MRIDMKIVGSYSRVVGVLYALDKTLQLGKDIWYTDDDFTYHIGPVSDNRYVTVPKAFLTDGASVPRIFWSIFSPWGVYGQAAIVHDYLCVNKRLTKNGNTFCYDLLQQEIDEIFYDAMKVAGTPVWKRSIIFAAVRFFHNVGL
jgi:hypothetical protein